jgi:Flp pilus assembly protein CpaB
MRKLNISIIVGVIVALIGASLVFFYGRHVNTKISDGKATQSVIVADEALAAGTSARDVAAHVHVAQIPTAYVVSGALTTMTQLTSTQAQTYQLVGAVAKGGQLSLTNFAQGATAGGIQPTRGNVAVAISLPINAGVARYLQPNQLVDVFVTYSSQNFNQTKLFASGVRVLSVSIANTKSDGSTSDSGTQPSGQVVALLDASPLVAQKIVNAVSLGTPYLAYAPTGGHTAKATTPQNVLNSR